MSSANKEYLRAIIPGIIIAIVTGMGTSYLTTREAMAELRVKVAAIEKDIEKEGSQREMLIRIEERLKGLQRDVDLLKGARSKRKRDDR